MQTFKIITVHHYLPCRSHRAITSARVPVLFTLTVCVARSYLAILPDEDEGALPSGCLKRESGEEKLNVEAYQYIQ